MLLRTPTTLLSSAACVLFLFFLFLHATHDTSLSSPSIPSRIYQTLRHPFHTSSRPSTTFPQKIWQTWKSSASDLEDNDASTVQSWVDMNPSYRYELLTDAAALNYVQQRLARHPRIADTYANITDPILRSDLLRYIVLYIDGGVYTDVDTLALRPIETWIPSENASKVEVVLGVEVDHAEKGFPDGMQFSFCQWTMMARPGHPLFWSVINYVVDALQLVASQRWSDVGNLKLDIDDVMNTTGPLAWSAAVFRHLSLQSRRNVTLWDFHNITEPKVVGDVMVLPVTSFANGQDHSNSKSCADPDALVQHLYKSSWWTSHGRNGREQLAECEV